MANVNIGHNTKNTKTIQGTVRFKVDLARSYIVVSVYKGITSSEVFKYHKYIDDSSGQYGMQDVAIGEILPKFTSKDIIDPLRKKFNIISIIMVRAYVAAIGVGNSHSVGAAFL